MVGGVPLPVPVLDGVPLPDTVAVIEDEVVEAAVGTAVIETVVEPDPVDVPVFVPVVVSVAARL